MTFSLDLELHASIHRQLELDEHGVVQFRLDPLPPLFYDFASRSQDGAADGLRHGPKNKRQ